MHADAILREVDEGADIQGWCWRNDRGVMSRPATGCTARGIVVAGRGAPGRPDSAVFGKRQCWFAAGTVHAMYPDHRDPITCATCTLNRCSPAKTEARATACSAQWTAIPAAGRAHAQVHGNNRDAAAFYAADPRGRRSPLRSSDHVGHFRLMLLQIPTDTQRRSCRWRNGSADAARAAAFSMRQASATGGARSKAQRCAATGGHQSAFISWTWFQVIGSSGTHRVVLFRYELR